MNLINMFSREKIVFHVQFQAIFQLLSERMTLHFKKQEKGKEGGKKKEERDDVHHAKFKRSPM